MPVVMKAEIAWTEKLPIRLAKVELLTIGVVLMLIKFWCCEKKKKKTWCATVRCELSWPC